MNRKIVLFLAFVMLLQCFSLNIVFGADIPKNPSASIFSNLKLEKWQVEELQKAYNLGLYPKEDLSRLDKPVTTRYLYELLGKTIAIVTGHKNTNWTKKTLAASNKPIQRQASAQIISSAAKDGLGVKKTFTTPKQYIQDYWFKDEIDPKYGKLNQSFDNLVFVSGLYDIDSKLRVMECTKEGYFRFGAHMTVLEAIQAAYRLCNLPTHLSASAIAHQAPVYVSIDKAGTFDKKIITEELLKKPSRLPEASNSSIPYWTGFCMENKIFTNLRDGRWDGVTDGSWYFYEPQIKFHRDRGFNCARVLYSLSFLSKTDDAMQINESELRQLDELISWGMKYDVHIMISITGLPGKANTGTGDGYEKRTKIENVQSNDELFRNTELANVYQKYMSMLAKRYAQIPNKNLSFELLAEPAVPNGDVALYERVLTPVVKSMWEESPGRIIIANDVYKQIPEGMAELGCCLSLHNFTYTVESSRLPGIDYKPKWPMEYLPAHFSNNKQILTLKSENTYEEGKFSIYIDCANPPSGTLIIKADGRDILEKAPTQSGWLTVAIPSGAHKLEIGIKEDSGFLIHWGVKIEQKGRVPTTIPVHDLYCGKYDCEMPTIQINNDGTVKNMDTQQKVLNSEYLQKEYLQKFIDCAKEHKVGFLLTEIASAVDSLSEAENIKYLNDWFSIARNNRIPWMYNCLENVLAPKERLYPYNLVHDTVRYERTPLHVYPTFVNFMKKYQ